MALIELHASMISMLFRCPRQYYWRYIMQYKCPPGWAQFLGTNYHYGLEVNFKQKEQSRADLQVEDIKDAFNTSWGKISQETEIIWEEERPENIKDAGYAMLQAYMHDLAPQVQPIECGTEYEFEVEIPSLDLLAKGRIDLIEETGYLIDHKTASKKWAAARPREEAQSYYYPIAWEKLTQDRLPMQFHVASHSQRGGATQSLTAEVDEQDLKWFENDVLPSLVRQVKEGLFPPRPNGWWCSERFCGWYGMCRRGELDAKYFIMPKNVEEEE
jgi:hypothetical protein